MFGDFFSYDEDEDADEATAVVDKSEKARQVYRVYSQTIGNELSFTSNTMH